MTKTYGNDGYSSQNGYEWLLLDRGVIPNLEGKINPDLFSLNNREQYRNLLKQVYRAEQKDFNGFYQEGYNPFENDEKRPKDITVPVALFSYGVLILGSIGIYLFQPRFSEFFNYLDNYLFK